jgi:parallel beta-helix repeat protein
MKKSFLYVIIPILLISSFAYLVTTRNSQNIIADSQQETPIEEEDIVDSGINNTKQFHVIETESLDYNYTYTGENISVTENLSLTRFVGCTLKLCKFKDVKIHGCQFVNSNIHIVDCQNITFSDNHVSQFYVHEDPAILVKNVDGLNFTSNTIFNNSIGMVITGGSNINIGHNVFEACDQHNAIMGLDSIARIHYNVFRYNFPHALMIMNREEDPSVQLEIFDNIFDRNIEDAINFEDFRGAVQPTLVYNNIINGTGQAGINVEYNSWSANIIIKNNIISENGLLNQQILDEFGRPISVYPNHGHQPEPYSEGWKHGVKLEDCSGVTIEGNIIKNNRGSGIECTNARDIQLINNTITGNMDGITLRNYDEASLSREFSSLIQSNAGSSTVYEMNNTVSGNQNMDVLVEEPCKLIEVN